MGAIKDGKLRGLAVFASQRSSAVPDVPTNAEAGVPGLESDTLTGIVAPAGAPRAPVGKKRKGTRHPVPTHGDKKSVQTAGLAPLANTPEEFGERIKSEIERWGKVVREANIHAD